MTRLQLRSLFVSWIGRACVVLAVLLGSHPSRASEPSASEVLRGRIKQLRTCLERTSLSLEQSDVPEFVKQYQRLSAAYCGAAEATEQSFRDLGAARIKVRLARQILAKLEASDSERQLEQERVEQLRQGVAAGRGVLLTRLAELQPTEKNSELVPNTLAEVASLVERIEQLDQLMGAGEAALSNASTSQSLVKPLDAIDRQLVEDEQVLKLQARLISELVEQRTREMQRALGYLEITASLPEEEVRRLREARGNLHGLLKQIDATRTETRKAVSAEAERPLGGASLNAQQLQERVAALLAPSNVGVPSAKPRLVRSESQQ